MDTQSRWPSSIEQGEGKKMINNFSIFLSFQSLIWVARPMLRSLKRLTTQTVLVDPIVRPTTNPNDPPNGGISRFVVSIIYNGSHTFQIGWIDSPHIGSVRERTRIGGGEEGGDIGMQRMKDRRMEEEGAGWTTHTSASNWLELFPRLISRTYLLVVVAASDRRRLHLAPDERDNFRLDCCWVRLA